MNRTPSNVGGQVIARIETAVRIDPGRRGVLGPPESPIGVGEIAWAARSLVENGRHAVLLTGFFVPTAEPPAAETDGPPGAVALAEVLGRLGITATLVTDPQCGAALRAAADAGGLPAGAVRVLSDSEQLLTLLREARPEVSHLIAIERVGPGYAHELVRSRCGEAAAARFLASVPQELWSRCLNMRGHPIDDWMVDFSSAFESPPTGVTTIGLGDGGNELGLGKFAWVDLASRLEAAADPRILCRVVADYAVLAGTSNWAAYALAATATVVAGRPEAFAGITVARQAHIISSMVRFGPAVDGVSRRFEATVDGLTPKVYFEPLRAIREALGH